MEEETVAGVVERVVHRRENWGVYDVSSAGATVRVKGNVHFREGEYVRLTAVAEDNERWGRQYVVRRVDDVKGPPPTSLGMSKFLAANVKGIGVGHVSNILETYGPGELVELLDGGDAAVRLTEVPGIGTARAKRIAETWTAGSADRRAVVPVVEKFGSHLTYGECRTAAAFGGAARREKFFDARPWVDRSAATADPLGDLEAEPYDLVDILKPHRRYEVAGRGGEGVLHAGGSVLLSGVRAARRPRGRVDGGGGAVSRAARRHGLLCAPLEYGGIDR